MKTILLIVTFLFSFCFYGQDIRNDKSCKVIQFVDKDSLNSASILAPIYNKTGFYLVTNGVYDFVIDGKKYFQSILLKIENDKFYISKNWESNEQNEKVLDSIEILINQKIQIRMVSIDNGVGNMPTLTSLKKYSVSIIPTDEYCRFENAEIVTNGKKYFGHYYFTALGLKKLKIVNKIAYLCDEGGEFTLRRR